MRVNRYNLMSGTGVEESVPLSIFDGFYHSLGTQVPNRKFIIIVLNLTFPLV